MHARGMNMGISREVKKFSPITYVAGCFFQAADLLAVRRWLCRWNRLFKPRWEITQDEANNKDYAMKRARAIEFYMVGWLILELMLVMVSLLLLSPPPWLLWLACIVGSLRIIEIVQVTVNTSIFDALSGRSDRLVASPERMVVLAAVNYFELMACFGLIYALNLDRLHGASNPLTAYYLSIITQTTIGFGDVHPLGLLRCISGIQAISSLFFMALVFTRFLDSLRTLKAALHYDGDRITAAKQHDEEGSSLPVSDARQQKTNPPQPLPEQTVKKAEAHKAKGAETMELKI